MSNKKPPLWEAMADTFDETATVSCRDTSTMLARCKAAEIRTVRDWLVPEEENPLLSYEPTLDDKIVHAMWKQREYFRSLLTAEANRAERGE